MEREEASRLLTEAGVRGALLVRVTEFCCANGHSETVWRVEQKGPDTYSDTILGVGTTIAEAIASWRLNHTPRGRRGT